MVLILTRGNDPMPKLSDTQAIILSAAAQRADGNLLPLPGSLRGGAASKVVGALLSRGFVEEIVIDDTRPADPALNTLWRNLDDGRAVLLRITAGRARLDRRRARDRSPGDRARDGGGLEPDSAPGAAPQPPPRATQVRQCSGAASAAPSGTVGQDPRGDEAGAADRHAGAPGRGNDRADRRGDRLAAAYRARCVRRRAEEAARAHRHLGEGRRDAGESTGSPIDRSRGFSREAGSRRAGRLPWHCIRSQERNPTPGSEERKILGYVTLRQSPLPPCQRPPRPATDVGSI